MVLYTLHNFFFTLSSPSPSSSSKLKLYGAKFLSNGANFQGTFSSSTSYLFLFFVYVQLTVFIIFLRQIRRVITKNEKKQLSYDKTERKYQLHGQVSTKYGSFVSYFLDEICSFVDGTISPPAMRGNQFQILKN